MSAQALALVLITTSALDMLIEICDLLVEIEITLVEILPVLAAAVLKLVRMVFPFCVLVDLFATISTVFEEI